MLSLIYVYIRDRLGEKYHKGVTVENIQGTMQSLKCPV